MFVTVFTLKNRRYPKMILRKYTKQPVKNITTSHMTIASTRGVPGADLLPIAAWVLPGNPGSSGFRAAQILSADDSQILVGVTFVCRSKQRMKEMSLTLKMTKEMLKTIKRRQTILSTTITGIVRGNARQAVTGAWERLDKRL